MTRRRYVQQADLTLKEVKVKSAPDHNGTFQVGDIPDMMKDVERRKADQEKRDKTDRLQTIISAVNKYRR